MGTLPIFILVTLAVLFGLLVMAVTAILGPKKPTPEKLAPYECGIQEIEAPKRRFPVKYLLTGMLFIVFDIEIVSFYPLAIFMYGERGHSHGSKKPLGAGSNIFQYADASHGARTARQERRSRYPDDP